MRDREREKEKEKERRGGGEKERRHARTHVQRANESPRWSVPSDSAGSVSSASLQPNIIIVEERKHKGEVEEGEEEE